jgi:hypothetical protein
MQKFRTIIFPQILEVAPDIEEKESKADER